MDRTIKDHFDCHRRQGTRPPALEGEVDALLEPGPSFVEHRPGCAFCAWNGAEFD